MSEINGAVPFPPEILNPKNGDLEAYIINSAEGRLPSPEHLRDTFHSIRIESYANWLSDLTKEDVAHRERGSVLHVEAGNKKIIFPTNPDVGEDACGWAVSKKRDKFVPTVDVHTHPENFCFSGHDADMTTFMSGWGEGVDHFIPVGMLVAAPNFNYLILKSNETPNVLDKWTAYDKGYVDNNNEFMDLRRYGSKLGKELSTSEYWKLFKQAEEARFRGNFESFYNSFMYTFNLAEAFKLGFYYSAKDGRYVRFTKEGVVALITSQLDGALKAVQERRRNY